MLVTIHIIAVIGTGLVVLYSDEQGFLWMLGKKKVLNQKRVALLHHLVAAGLAVLLITGGLLYIQAVPYYLSDPTFIIKLIAISALILNTYAIERFSKVAISKTFSSLTSSERLPLLVSGVVSVLGWITALVCGILLAHTIGEIFSYFSSLV